MGGSQVSKAHERDLSAREVGELIGLDHKQVGKLARQGRFPNAYKAGSGKGNSPIRIPYSDIEHYRKTQPRVSA